MSNKSISTYSKLNTWIIENYLSYFCKIGMCISSFSSQNDCGLQIKLYPSGVSSSCFEFISCFLERKSAGEIELDCKLEMTDFEGSIFASKEFCVKSNVILFRKFICIDELLTKMAESEYDTVIIKCHTNKIHSETCSVSESIARTIIGVERRCFTWYLKSLDTDLTKRKTVYFPKSSEMEFRLSTSETDVTIMVINSCWFDNVYYEDAELDDVKKLNHYEDRSLLIKISFFNIVAERFLTQQSYLDFEERDGNSRQCCFKFKRDLLQFDSIFPLRCEISLSHGTYIKHVNFDEVD